MDLKPRLFGGGTVVQTERGWMLSIPAGSGVRYRLAQLDDHLRIPRKQYPWRPPMQLALEARVSAGVLPGTWGFGLWNDPYGFSFGPGNGFLRLPTLPNAAWFFFSSPISYLSFRDDTPGNGLLAQLFSSPGFHPLLIRAILTFPFSRQATRRILSRLIREEAVRLDAGASTGSGPRRGIDVMEWHSYALEWTEAGTRFLVDQAAILEASFSPRPPLGFVIWIDNQHAAFRPDGMLSFGMESHSAPAWLEIQNLHAQ